MSVAQRAHATDSEVPGIWVNDELIRFTFS
jgi:hypothetical protein